MTLATATTDIEFATLANGDKVPRYLYRYLSIDEKLIASIKEQYLWFTDPVIFNDPYDCNLKLKNVITDETVTGYLEVVNNLTKSWNDGELKERIDYYKKNKNEVETNLNNELLTVVKTCGVCCLSEKPDILLMWSHYAQKHSGVCLKYDIKQDASLFHQTSLVKVKYPDHYPQFDFMRYLKDNGGQPGGKELIEFVVGIKSKDWEYESEIRLVRWEKHHGTYRGKIEVNKNALVGAYFGYKTENAKIGEVINALKDCGYPLQETKKAVLNHDDFGLTFENC